MPTSRARVRRRRPAFALIAVLLLTALALVCAFGALKATASFERENENLVALGCARSAALAGAKIALADLQTYTGTDACATAKIVPSASASEWLGAWHGKRIRQEFSSGAVPLVSARGVFAGTRSCFLRDAARMSAPAEVPWEKLGENVRFAYFILDESLRASAARREREAHLRRFGGDPETLARLRRQVPRNTHFAHFLDGETLPAALFPEKLAAAPDEKILLAALGDAVPRERRAAARETFTLDAQGVPADWPRRALKFDFFDEKNAALAEAFLPAEAAETLRAAAEDGFRAGTPVATARPAPAGAFGWTFAPFPIPAELTLHVGVFNPRSDGQHRARFHVTARLWNPYAFPLLAREEGLLGMVDFENLPAVCIRNENTGGEFVFSPTDFPVGRFGIVRQTPSDRTCNAYCRIFDATPQGFGEDGNAAGLHGGEVFLARFPDPRAQPQGLARNAGGPSWKYQKDPEKIAKPPYGAEPGRWFHPAHEISVVGLPGALPASFLIRGAAGTLRQETFPRDYAAPVFELRNVALPFFSTTLSGAEYNREKAGDYDASQATFAWKIRLRAEDAAAMRALFAEADPRLGVFDFSVPAVRAAFEVSALAGSAARAEAEIGGNAETPERLASPLRDPFPNEHAAERRNAFACARIFEAPAAADALSVGALAHGAFAAFPCAGGFGEPFPEAEAAAARERGVSPNSLFDRAYFSAEGKNPHHVRRGENFLVSGAFNVNSVNADAWAAALPRDVPAQGAAGRHLARAFFTLPFSAQIPPAAGTRELRSDEEIAALSGAERERVLFAQGAREVGIPALRSLAEAIAEEIRARRERGSDPFRSLEEFADSGVLKAALRKSRFNAPGDEEIPAWAPAAIDQGSLMEALAPFAAPRGDTFTILCRAEAFDPATGKIRAAACAEMRVQRTAEFFDASQPADTPAGAQNALNRVFGRRYEIEFFRWVPADEL